jgi:AraC-like DNA-binding protein
LPRQSIDSTRLNLFDAAGTLAVGDLAAFVHDLTHTLRQRTDDGYLNIDSAAQLVRMSVRTLQRNLAKAGLTYSKVVEYARFEAAAEMLATPDLKIIDIAYSLGYEDPSHFSRAFRRMIGESPREFRLKRFAKNAA